MNVRLVTTAIPPQPKAPTAEECARFVEQVRNTWRWYGPVSCER